MSGRKNTLRKFNTIAAGDMSQATLTSAVTDIQFLDDVGVQFTWTGSPVGEFSVEVSADYEQDGTVSPPVIKNAGNWAPLTFTYWDVGGSAFVTAQAIPTSVGSPIYLDMALLSSPWIRCKYTKVSGTGTLVATITAKEV